MKEAAGKLNLRDVTLVAADSIFLELTRRALHHSMDQVDFGDAILFSDRDISGRFRRVPIAPLAGIDAYSRFCIKELPGLIETPYVLVVQWDGYVVAPEAWARAFLKFDFIGAPWPTEPRNDLSVGNGGFSLRSRKLLKAIAALNMAVWHPEDHAICQIYRRDLEQNFGIRIAPLRIADRFSHEYGPKPDKPTFGFHGITNLWRHVQDGELAAMVEEIVMTRVKPHGLVELAVNAAEHGSERAAQALYRRIATHFPDTTTRQVLIDLYGRAAGARQAMLAALL